MISTGYRDNWNYGRHGQQHAPYFGTSVGTAVGKKLAESGQDILNLSTAEKLYKFFGKGLWVADPRKGGLSTEDVAARLLNIVAITIPQGLVAIWTNTSPWERNAQNVIALVMGVGLGVLFKNSKFGFNSLLDPFMKPLPSNAGWLRNLFKPLHPDVDYFDILKAAKVEFKEESRKRAFWAGLDGNQRALVDALQSNLRTKAMKGNLNPAERRILKALPRFRAQLIAFPFLSASLITLATVYVLGYVTTKFVFKVFVPLDEKREKQAEKQKKNEKPATASTNTALPYPSFRSVYPVQYQQAFSQVFQPFSYNRGVVPFNTKPVKKEADDDDD